MLSELHEVELNLFPVVASMTGPAESEADGLVPESVNGTFKSIIKEPVPLGEVLVAGQDDASCLFETDAVYQLEEEKSLLPVELAVADLIDDEAGILGKSVQTGRTSRYTTGRRGTRKVAELLGLSFDTTLKCLGWLLCITIALIVINNAS